MPLPRISNTPGSATDAPTAATDLNLWADQIEASQANISSNTSVITNVAYGNTALGSLVNDLTVGNLALFAAIGGVGSTKTSALPAASTLLGSELVALVQGGINVQSTINSFLHGSAANYIDFSTYVGFDPTGATDQSAILQQAVIDAIAASKQLRIPVGLYLLNSPVDLAPSLHAGLDMVGITSPTGYTGGLGFALPGFGVNVFFKANFNDRPGFYFTAARWIHLANFVIVGLNAISQFQASNDIKANYNVGGCRDTQWSPYCGIAIDAFNIVVPADGGYPGMSAKYNLHGSNGSSGGVFENVHTMGFIVGWGIGLSGNAAGGTDTMTWYNCRSTICDTAVAVGQPQSKDCIFFLGGYGSCRTGFDGANYGAKQGVPIPMYGINFGYLYRIFNYSSQFGPLFLHDSYCESVRSIGNFGTGGSTPRGHGSIMNMQFSMEVANAGPMPPLLLETYGLFSFRDCNFSVNSGNAYTWNFGNDITSPITFDTCTFSTTPTSGIPPLVGMSSTGPVAKLVNCLATGTFPYQPISDESTIDVSAFTINNRFIGPQRSAFFANGTGAVYYQSSTILGYITVAATATAFTTRAITFTTTLALGAVSGTLTAPWADVDGWNTVLFSNGNVKTCLFHNGSTAVTWGADGLASSATASATAQNVGLTFNATDVTLVQVNDIFLWKMVTQGNSAVQRVVPGWIVTGIVGSVVTCAPLFDSTEFDTVGNNGGGTSMFVCQIPWAPSGAALTCTTSTSVNLTLVSPISVLKNGDWVNGAGLAANSRVVSGGGTANITLNKATSASAAGVALSFGRFQTATMTPTW